MRSVVAQITQVVNELVDCMASATISADSQGTRAAPATAGVT